jgi:hypothetical protein
MIRAAFTSGGSPNEILGKVMEILKGFGKNKLGVFAPAAAK